jgi:Amidase
MQLDYVAGVLPVTRVNARQDALPSLWQSRNTVERNAYKQYNSRDMADLPVGVQVIGRRLEEEKVLEGMKAVQSALRAQGIMYRGIFD